MDPSPSAARGPALFGLFLALLYVAGLGTVLYFLGTGADFYLTPVAQRARHPQFWDLKPGGEIGLRLGVVGLAMMTLMHGYSARKRVRGLRGLGPLRQWLNVHILLGILGPLFVVLHSSFKVGGLISISFWSMVAVALSGVFGRYLYLQIPRTRAGEELSLAEVERADRALSDRLREEFGADAPFLARIDALSGPAEKSGLLRTLAGLVLQDLGIRRRAESAVAGSLPALPAHLVAQLGALVRQKALLRRRILLWDALHRAFHHWHVIHKPFAVVMYLFVIVHVVVASLTGYGWPF